MAESWYRLGPFTVFDLETTGLLPARDRILEIGAVRIETDGTISRFSSLINPAGPIPPKATAVNGITDEMVSNAPFFKETAFRFLEFIGKSRLVTHNARFDLAFLQESLVRAGMQPLKNGAYDSITLIRKAFPNLPSYRLQSLRTTLHLPVPEGDPHRAAFDAELTLSAFGLAMKQLCDLYPMKEESGHD